MNRTKREREIYNFMRNKVCNDLKITKNQYNSFRRLGNELCKIYTDYCNGDIQNEDDYEVLKNTPQSKAEDLATSLGLHIYFQTDPRGATIYLDTKPISYDNYHIAHCIY